MKKIKTIKEAIDFLNEALGLEVVKEIRFKASDFENPKDYFGHFTKKDLIDFANSELNQILKDTHILELNKKFK